ncbi:SDR family NAD(P)-dependent oxidoreductase [Nesterenkonia sp. LB17]|uniref:SDR family NAD(P)-dependent oxidoreductase n=1 Tax=unclassified Nesterenkonia TaxID=2629769 RepID=UPI001F4CC433|nr:MULTISPECIES: SDR family NAD(P)-dependent oxidoreductase [unclassified Nesterenkonia]MCH8560466.1 SDR family NAD(P)-dependent oxidoreductase [Nesterenkonia sp. DZ6]MCH8565782.1 SDR family NAD(P)-dependent oxidoreductase [Nesterenkonia sp. LB17]MCH8570574.1 SDR family NAD(P)-dependent oxidoreductase [Nesterenkonia sp. AY15]
MTQFTTPDTEPAAKTSPAAAGELTGRTALISGGSRGIGHAIAVALAARGANVALLAKTDTPHPKLAGTVHTAVEDIRAAGGQGLAVVGDVRRDEDVLSAVEQTVEAFGGIDIVINNASAIDLSPTEVLDMKRYDLMHDINVRGTFLLSKTAAPHLRTSAAKHRAPADGTASGSAAGAAAEPEFTPQILTLSPPLALSEAGLDPIWLGRHLAYTMSKYGMSMTTVGLAAELEPDGVAVNSLWPATYIDTAAIRNLAALAGEQGETMIRGARRVDIVADAAVAMLSGQVTTAAPDGKLRPISGAFLTDEQVLRQLGVEDFTDYAVDPEAELIPDAFL